MLPLALSVRIPLVQKTLYHLDHFGNILGRSWVVFRSFDMERVEVFKKSDSKWLGERLERDVLAIRSLTK